MSVKRTILCLSYVLVLSLSVFEDGEITGLSQVTWQRVYKAERSGDTVQAGTDAHTYLNSHAYKRRSNDPLLT